MSDQILTQVFLLLKANRKAEATSLLFEHFGSLNSAKEKINELMQNIAQIPEPENSTQEPFSIESLTQQVEDLLAQNRKIEAVKLVKQVTGLGLKESKDWVENLESNTRDFGDIDALVEIVVENSEAGNLQPSDEESLLDQVSLQTQVKTLLAQSKKLEAIKLVK